MFKAKSSKRRGAAALLIIVTLAVVISLIAISTAKISQASQESLASSKTALQAHQYAAAKAEIIAATEYDDLAAQTKAVIPNTSFYDEITISGETDYPANTDIKQRTCTINVYKGSEVLPRYSLKTIRYSAAIDDSVPKGTILPWYGNLSQLPKGYAVCNGKNGTPDLRDKFLVGAGSTYNLGATGGAAEVKLIADQNVSHYHRFGRHTGNNTGYFLTSAGSFQLAPLASWMRAGKWNGSGGGGYNGWDGGSGTNFSTGQNLVTSLAIGTDASNPHENRPPYYALYYIMKL